MSSSFTRFELENFAKVAAQSYLGDGADLNSTIAKMARENDFTSHHIDRVTQTANTFVNGALVKKARDQKADPRVKFDLASSEKVAGLMRGGQEKTASLRARAEIEDLYRVPARALDRERVLDGVLGKLASDPLAHEPHSVDHVELAGEYLRSPGRVEKVATVLTSASIGMALQTLESLEAQAEDAHMRRKLAMDDAERELRSEIHDQILFGAAPATVRDVIKQAGLEGHVSTYLDTLVTKVAASVGAREGGSALDERSVVNAGHPLLTKAASLSREMGEALTAKRGLDKIAGARARARHDLAAAARGGR
jgi:hypothetical protein